jgi:hypothetical protein
MRMMALDEGPGKAKQTAPALTKLMSLREWATLVPEQ